ncbi:MAG: hypothetical protein J6A30_01305 [Ruminococcus sp.]|nr:hypothetical protein [Ruminococcus sp.]
MMNEFNKAMDKICPSEQQKNRMFDKALEMAEDDAPKTVRRPKLKIIAASIIAAAALVGTTTVFADEIKSAFYKFFSDDSTISQDIIENIYEDSDGHVVFSVSRIVSDKINTYAIVKYTALDEVGEDWLDNRFASFDLAGTAEDMLNRGLFIKPDDSTDNYVSYMFGITDEEITDTAEDNSRVFRISCTSEDVVLNSDCVKIEYVMTSEKTHYALLDVSESLELTDIKLDRSIAADKPYIPTGVKLSPLGIMIYGENNGLYETSENGDSTWTTSDEKLDSVKIIRKDGSAVKYSAYLSLCSVNSEGKDYDTVIFSTFFKEPVDIADIDGVEINGVFYEF